jgi:hypothetical protein
VVELPSRSRMRLDADVPIVGSFQGVWPGIPGGGERSGEVRPTGSPWIDTNAGFLRSARSWGNAAVWIANLPPPKSVISGERYLQAIADAGISGARWVNRARRRLLRPVAEARGNRAARLEERSRRRSATSKIIPSGAPCAVQPAGLVQDPAKGGLLSGASST